MKYIIEPLNENQEMNCRVKFSGNKAEAFKKAVGIASAMQAVLDGASITCRIRPAYKGQALYADESAEAIIATPDCQPLYA